MSWKDNKHRRNKSNQRGRDWVPIDSKFRKVEWTPEMTEKIRELAKWFEHFTNTHGRQPTQAEINEFGKTQKETV